MASAKKKSVSRGQFCSAIGCKNSFYKEDCKGKSFFTFPRDEKRDNIRQEYVSKHKPYRGELGVESYEAWQIEDFIWIQRFVEDFVDDFVFKYIPTDDIYLDEEFRWALQRTDDIDWQQTTEALSETKVVKLVAEAILLQETRGLMRKVAAEVLHVHGTLKNMSDKLFMREIKAISTGLKEVQKPKDSGYDIFTRNFFTAQRNRSRCKKTLWSHSQTLTGTKEGMEQMEGIDSDIELITFDHLHPIDLQKFKFSASNQPAKEKEYAVRYCKREAEFWMGMEAEFFTVTLPNACKGVQCMRPSPDGTFMAVGTTRGDILVYDVKMDPWHLVCIAPHSGHKGGRTLHVAWSLDGTRIASVSKDGSLQVWEVEGSIGSRQGIQSLRVEPDRYGNLPKQLRNIVSLDVKKDDFIFQLGPITDTELLTAQCAPIWVSFYPSFSFLGVQNEVCSIMDNCDIMKINLASLSTPSNLVEDVTIPTAPLIYQPNIYDERHGVNIVGQNLKAELFRQHQNSVLFLGFIDNISQMVTVDDMGLINIWKYDPEYISGFGYFTPEKKYRLEMNKKVYIPSNTDKSEVQCSKLLSVEPTPSGRDLVLVLLFPEHQSKESHIMVLILDLVNMKLHNWRRDIHLSTREHDMLIDQPVISFSTTRVLAPTGAEYLFILMEGKLSAISLTTGNLVLRVDDLHNSSDFMGCSIDNKSLSLGKTAEVTSVCVNGNIYAAFHDKALTSVKVLRLIDNNDCEGRRLMWKAYQMWNSFRRVRMPPEMRVGRTSWLLSDKQHIEVAMRRLILDLVDEKVFMIQKEKRKGTTTRRTNQDNTEIYKALEAKARTKALLASSYRSDFR